MRSITDDTRAHPGQPAARWKFEESVKRFNLTDADLIAQHRQYLLRAFFEAFLLILFTMVAVFIYRSFGRELGLAAGLMAFTRLVAIYLCVMRAWAIRHRELPSVWAWRWR